MLVIRWYGHACFEIITSSGVVIAIDPHDGRSIGLKPPHINADIVLITHDHFDHNAYATVAKPSARVLSMSIGETVINNIKVIGVETYHDKDKGKRRGRNVVYKLIANDINIVHLGDLGHAIGEEGNMLKPIDILMIPVGGVFTIDAREAWDIVKTLDPVSVIPMHYWIKGLELPIKPVDDFLSLAPSTWNKIILETNMLSINKDSLKPKTIYILRYIQ